MNNKLVFILITLPMWCLAGEEASNATQLPNITIEQAIEKAKAYTSSRGINLKNKSIVNAEYHSDIINRYKNPYWSIIWATNITSKNTVVKGGGYEVRIFDNGRIEETFYK